MSDAVRDGQPTTLVVHPPPTGRRAEILAVAAKVIAAKGVQGASSSDIATAAGILSGSLYHHFRSKEQILAEMMVPLTVRQLDRYRTVVAEEAARRSPADVVLHRLIEDTVTRVADHLDVAIILRNDQQVLSQLPAMAQMRDCRQASFQLWSAVVRDGVEQGVLRVDLEPDEVVSVLLDAILGTVRLFTGPRPADSARVGRQLANMLMSGLAVTQPPVDEPGD